MAAADRAVVADRWPRAYRNGPLEPQQDCLLDVLAAAQAARLSGQRFAFGRSGLLPTLTEVHAASALAALAALDTAPLTLGQLDLLRGLGQLGTLAERAATLTARPAADIVRWREPLAARHVSLRWETLHVSDQSAAARPSGAVPVERWSHPGRNILALLTVAQSDPAAFADTEFDWDRGAPLTFRRYARRWYAPHTPITYDAWHAIIHGGAEPPCLPIPGADQSGDWYTAAIVDNGRMPCLGLPCHRQLSQRYRAVRAASS